MYPQPFQKDAKVKYNFNGISAYRTPPQKYLEILLIPIGEILQNIHLAWTSKYFYDRKRDYKILIAKS